MRKRWLSLLLVICMVLTLMPVFSTQANGATSKTQAEAVSWAKSQIGKSLDYDGAYGAQCVDLIFYYYSYLGKDVAWGNGSDFAYNTLPPGWSRISYSSGVTPQPGDIAVWTVTASGNTNGHVAIVISSNSTSFDAIDQNWNGSYCEQVTHRFSAGGTLACFIRPDFTGSYPIPAVPVIDSIVTTADSATIKWNAVKDAASYSIQFCSGDWTKTDWYYTTNTSYTISNLAEGSYHCRVMALNTAGECAPGSEVPFKSLQVGVFPAPAIPNVSVSTAEDLSISVSWEPVEYAVRYAIQFCNADWSTSDWYFTDGTSYKFEHLSNNTAYHLRVVSINQNDVSCDNTQNPFKWVNMLYITPALHATANENGGVEISWEESSWSGYWIRRADSERGPWTLIREISGGGKRTITDDTTESGKTYYYQLQPYNVNRQGQNYGNIVCVTTAAACANGHSIELRNVKNATCTEAGYTGDQICSRCGAVVKKGETIPAKGHSWDNGKVTQAATCTEAGVRTYTCKHDSSHTRTEAIPALGHDYKAVVTAPTCTEKGYTTHTCSRCGDSYVDSYVAAQGHKTELRNAKAATCTADGYTGDEICSICGEMIRKGTVIKATGHKWDSGKVTKQPTETAEGVKTFTCTVCGETRTEAIPKLTHTHSYTDVVTPPTCTEQGYTTHTCAGCGESYVDSYVDALGHKTELRNAKAATCTADGYTGDEICTVCGATVKQGTVIKASGHKWDNGKVTKEPTETAEGVKTFTCTVCGETRTEAIPKLTPVTPTNPFVDVKQGEYYYDPVLWAVNHQPQITNGTSATTFSPDATCTRGQVVTFLWRANGCPEPKSTSNPFKDVASGAYYYKAVLWAVENGITNGTSATTFSPEDPCTRAHVVTFLWRSANKPAAGTTNPFTDVTTGQYYTDAVLWAVSKSITNGTSATTFSPDNPCTRGQIVTFLYRYMK